MKQNLLHIVDMQYDFVASTGKLAVAGAENLIGPANAFIRTADMDKIIATFDTHDGRTYANSAEGKMFPAHCIDGTRGWQSAIDLPATTRGVRKDQFDVWAVPSAMENALRDMPPAQTDVFVMGVASDFCVKYAIMGYLNRGYRVTAITDLCRGIQHSITDVAAELNHKKLRLMQMAQILNQRGK